MADMGTEPEAPTVEWALRVFTENRYEGGFGGTCYGCLFATGPVNQDGSPVDPGYYNHDQTEAYYTCNLPTRDPEARNPDWGEYAPCLAGEWARWIADQAVEEYKKQEEKK